jgi:putative phage-type endonuclease
MKTHDLIQGSPEWLAYRAQHFNASDAPAMMGCSPYKTRAQLLAEMHTGIAAAVDIGTQKRFDNGHRAEALARPLAEEFIGAELYPVTGSLGRLSASFDGLKLDENEGFEHKALNDAIRAAFDEAWKVRADDAAPGRMLPIYHRVQMEQQLHVSGAERILFMASAWTADEELIEERHCWYYPDATLRQQIIDGWAQFERDLDAYTPTAAEDPAPVGQAPESLPALRIEVTGEVTASNLAEFKQTALAAIRSVNRDLKTDADFADAEKAVKWCSDVESRLKAAKEHALSQTASIDALFKTIDDIGAEAKRVRLDLDKLVTRRKDECKASAVSDARAALQAHVDLLNAELAPMRLLPVAVDFAGAIKGLRSIASMQDALDTALAQGKIAADNQARGIRANVATFAAQAYGVQFLFADLAQIVHKAGDDFGALVSSRIAAHKAAEVVRERKRAEADQARVAAEAQRLAAEQILMAQEAERAAQAAQQQAPAPAAAPAPAPMVAPAPQAVSRPAAAPPAPRADEPATLNLGAICGRLGFTVSAQFLADVLHVQPARTDKASKLYTERQFAVICGQLVSHVSAMAELYAGEPA